MCIVILDLIINTNLFVGIRDLPRSRHIEFSGELIYSFETAMYLSHYVAPTELTLTGVAVERWWIEHIVAPIRRNVLCMLQNRPHDIPV